VAKVTDEITILIVQGVIILRKIFAFFLTVAIILNSILVVSFAATYKTITISPGQSWEFVNKTMTVAGISQKSSGKFDSAAYDASGSVSFVYYREEGSVYAAEGGRTVVTVPSSSRAIQFEYDSEKLTVRQASAPAVRAFTLNPGSNYEFTRFEFEGRTVKTGWGTTGGFC